MRIILLLAVLSLGGCGATREQLAIAEPLNEIVVQADKDELIKCTVYRMRDKWKSTSLLAMMGPTMSVEQTSYGKTVELTGSLSGNAQFIMKFTDQDDGINIKLLGNGRGNQPWEILNSCLS